jgi:hypothetical protein
VTQFQEIAHTGGKIEFIYKEHEGVSTRISHQNPWATTMVQLCMSYDGKVLDFISCGGIGSEIPYPQPSVPVFLLSDREGLFGQKCPKCMSYFRSNCITGNTTCPYCGKESKGTEYLTNNQLIFLDKYFYSLISSLQEKKTITLNLDEVLNDSSENTPKWILPEERQQSKIQCSCYCSYDILGDFGLCPSCSKNNFLEVIAKKLDIFEEQFEEVKSGNKERADREIEWEKLTRCVSEFESLANTIRKYLANLPATKKRRNDLNRLSFQNIIQSSEKLLNWFDIDILKDISSDDKIFLNKMFNRRHVFIHLGGMVDQEYINKTGDKSVRVNEKIRFGSKEIKRLIPLIRKCSNNLIKDYSGIT